MGGSTAPQISYHMPKQKVLLHIVTNPFITTESWLRLKILNLIFGIKNTDNLSFHLKITYWNPFQNDKFDFIRAGLESHHFLTTHIEDNHLEMLYDIYKNNISLKKFTNLEDEFSDYLDSITFESSKFAGGYNGGSHLIHTWNEVDYCIRNNFDYYYFTSTNDFRHKKNSLTDCINIHDKLTTRSILYRGIFKNDLSDKAYRFNTYTLNTFCIKISNLLDTFDKIKNDSKIKINSFENLIEHSFLQKPQKDYREYFSKTYINKDEEIVSKLCYDRWKSEKIFPIRNLEGGVAFFDFISMCETILDEDEFELDFDFLFTNQRLYPIKETFLVLFNSLKLYNIDQSKNNRIKHFDGILKYIFESELKRLKTQDNKILEERHKKNYGDIEFVRSKLVDCFNETFNYE